MVAAAIIAGFFIVGSPQEERLRRFDAQRIQDLQFLQSEIVFYWQNKNTLPGNLEVLRNDIRGISIPRDPQTGESYGYEVRGPLTFALCANFARPLGGFTSDAARPKPLSPKPSFDIRGDGVWEHEAGYTCFERMIDTDFFKPRKEEPERKL